MSAGRSRAKDAAASDTNQTLPNTNQNQQQQPNTNSNTNPTITGWVVSTTQCIRAVWISALLLIMVTPPRSDAAHQCWRWCRSSTQPRSSRPARIRDKGSALGTEAVETQDKGGVSATKAVKTQGKGSVLATKAAETRDNSSVHGPTSSPVEMQPYVDSFRSSPSACHSPPG